MKFCNNCGKELSDDAKFCTGCGASATPQVGAVPADPTQTGAAQTGAAPVHAAQTNQSAMPGNQDGYYHSSPTPPAAGQQGAPNTGYYQGSTPLNTGGAYVQNMPNNQGTPANTGVYYQGNTYPQQQPAQGAQYNQANMPGAPNVPSGQYYPGSMPGAPQGSPYGGGPNYPKKPGGNKALVIVIVAIIAVVLVGGGIFAAMKLSQKNKPVPTDNNTSPSVSASAEPSVMPSPSEEPSPSPSEEESPSPSEDVEPSASGNGADALTLFDSETADNVLAAFDEIGLDAGLIKGLEYYNDWVDGSVYTLTYKNSVVDILLHEDGTVFSIECSGTQVYLNTYESYKMDDYLGGKQHYDETAPTSGYVFYVLPGTVADSAIGVDVADDYSYVVQLLEPSDGSLINAFYMDASTPLTIEVPAGTYDIQFAVGTDWQGVNDLFGPDTLYFGLDDTVTLSPDSENNITLDITNGTGSPFHDIDPNA